MSRRHEREAEARRAEELRAEELRAIAREREAAEEAELRARDEATAHLPPVSSEGQTAPRTQAALDADREALRQDELRRAHAPSDEAELAGVVHAELERAVATKLDQLVDERLSATEPAPGVVTTRRDRWADGRLVAAAMLGPIAWFVDLVATWMIVPAAHLRDHVVAVRATHVVALAVALAGLGLAIREQRHLPVDNPDDVGVQRARFVGRAAFALALAGVLLVVGTLIPSLMLVPGAEP